MKATQTNGRQLREMTMHGIKLIHGGTELSCRLTHNARHTGLLVLFNMEGGDFKNPDVRISVQGKSLIDSFFPSDEGTVIWCQLNSGEQRYYETRTGKQLTEKQLQKQKADGKVHFIQ
ncbi:MAG: hypothetical protein EXS51_00675 [Candidatus Taylorbacteria bacterium]|nr:hypothetical protein [Candidatus Taylorbacteria bacterium]